MEEFLREVGITKPGEYSKQGAYVIDLEDDVEFGKMYTILDKSDILEEMDENQLITVDEAHVSYMDIDGEYQVSLIGDFNSGIYRVVVNELQGEDEE